jgi:hypothetical protein
MRKIILPIIFIPFCLGLFIVCPVQAEVYKYTDKDGVESYSDSIQAVPDKYRKKAVEVKGLREKDEAAKTSESVATAKTSSQTESVKTKLRKAAEDFKEKGYWRHVGVAAVFLIIVMFIRKLTRTMGNGLICTLIKFVLALCFVIGVFYIYSKEISGVFDSLLDRTSAITNKVDRMKRNVYKRADDNK